MTHPEFLRDEIQKLVHLERRSAEGLESLGLQASDERLRNALRLHAQQAASRSRKIRDVCERRAWADDESIPNCLEGIQREARGVLSGESTGAVADASIVCVAERLLHLGIASYQTALAIVASDPELVKPLAQGLDELWEADSDLEWALRSAIAPAAAKEDVSKGCVESTRR